MCRGNLTVYECGGLLGLARVLRRRSERGRVRQAYRGDPFAHRAHIVTFRGIQADRAVARLIRAGLPGAQVRVQSDDNTHFAAHIVAREFAQLKSLARHQLVYRALGELMGREIHALSIEALTPDEAAEE